ncbi:MAG: 30S ribosomal protein S16 [Candidatus Marinimicrobia bacterium]|nr:30S ribosomal protein S16 [Candidatus Neomarinimicrobiota bacterium]
MATIMRLTRTGRRNRPYYRIVVMDSRKRRDGRYIEKIGTYDPIKKDDNVKFSEERVQHWLGQGVQLSDTVRSILSNHGLLLKNHLNKTSFNDGIKKMELEKWEMAQAEKKKRKENSKKVKTEAKSDEKKEDDSKEESLEAKATDDSSSVEEKPVEAKSDAKDAEEKKEDSEVKEVEKKEVAPKEESNEEKDDKTNDNETEKETETEKD